MEAILTVSLYLLHRIYKRSTSTNKYCVQFSSVYIYISLLQVASFDDIKSFENRRKNKCDEEAGRYIVWQGKVKENVLRFRREPGMRIGWLTCGGLQTTKTTRLVVTIAGYCARRVERSVLYWVFCMYLFNNRFACLCFGWKGSSSARLDE